MLKNNNPYLVSRARLDPINKVTLIAIRAIGYQKGKDPLLLARELFKIEPPDAFNNLQQLTNPAGDILLKHLIQCN